MQMRLWQKLGAGGLLALTAFAASWWAGQRPYITPGMNRVFHMDSTLGAMFEFLVLMFLAGVGVLTLTRIIRGGWVFAAIAGSYMAAVVLVSLLTPRTIVSIGDSYCWDMWCVGIHKVNGTPQGENVLYTAEVSLFADSSQAMRVPAEEAKHFFYAVDQQGRRFPILRDSSFVDADVIVKPGEPAKSSVAFLAPAGARNLYLTGDIGAPPWVRLYFGSDLNPFHRRTLLRVV